MNPKDIFKDVDDENTLGDAPERTNLPRPWLQALEFVKMAKKELGSPQMEDAGPYQLLITLIEQSR